MFNLATCSVFINFQYLKNVVYNVQYYTINITEYTDNEKDQENDFSNI